MFLSALLAFCFSSLSLSQLSSGAWPLLSGEGDAQRASVTPALSMCLQFGGGGLYKILAKISFRTSTNNTVCSAEHYLLGIIKYWLYF